jgi:hypothetical protein
MERMTRLLAVTACSAMALALGTASAGESKVIIINAPAGKMDAFKVVKDKQTGKVRAATSEEIEEMNAAPLHGFAPNAAVLSRPASTLTFNADGSMTGRRSFDELDSLVVERSADGKTQIRHGAKQAPAAAKPALPKE